MRFISEVKQREVTGTKRSCERRAVDVDDVVQRFSCWNHLVAPVFVLVPCNVTHRCFTSNVVNSKMWLDLVKWRNVCSFGFRPFVETIGTQS